MNRLDRPTWAVIIGVITIALGWAVYSQQAWEDYYITYRASKNLAEGHGLTFTPGEKVHSFTSPLGVLLPAASFLATGRSSDNGALWIFRILSIAALAAAVALIWRAARRLMRSIAPAILLVALLATDSKTVSFSINGMETGILLFFGAWAIWTMFTLPARMWLHLGLAWGGMMWTRPDACIYIAAMAVGALLFAHGPASTRARQRVWWCRQLLAAGAVCATVYLPWFGWATWYYGTPVPHTITAKGLFNDLTAAKLISALPDFPSTIAAGQSSLRWTFLPAYGVPEDWPALVPALTGFFACLPLFVCLLPFARWEARFTSFVYVVAHFYLTVVVGSVGPWYVPLVAWFGLITLAFCFSQGLSMIGRLRKSEPRLPAVDGMTQLLWVVGGVMIIGSTSLCVVMCRQARVEMQISEGMVRRPIGEWLHERALSSRETVFLEPLGFIGFFSGLKMLDYPGLSSPEVVAARKRAKNRLYLLSWPELTRDLKPDWLVLRPSEERYFTEHDVTLLRENYRLVKKFDATDAVTKAGWIPIPSFVEYNTRVSIYRRWAAERQRTKGELGSLFQPTLSDFTRKDALAPVEVTKDGKISAHAPSVLTLPLPTGARQVSGRYGIAEGAFQSAPPVGTDGAEFRVEAIDAHGNRTVLLQRLLEPYPNLTDRGPQEFEAEIPRGSISIEFIVGTGPLNHANFDWTYWDRLTIASPALKP